MERLFPEVNTGGIKLTYTKLALLDSCCTFETYVFRTTVTKKFYGGEATETRIIRSAIKRLTAGY